MISRRRSISSGRGTRISTSLPRCMGGSTLAQPQVDGKGVQPVPAGYAPGRAVRFHEVELVSPSPRDAVRFYGERVGLPTSGTAVIVGSSVLRFRAGTPPAPYHLA